MLLMESIAENIALRNLDFIWKKQIKECYLQPSLKMTSNNSFAVLLICCADIPLPWRHDRNFYVFQLAVNCASISHYESSKLTNKVKKKDFIIIPLNATTALWEQKAKQHGVSENLFSLQHCGI